jgi:hypothetical protein
MQRAPFPGPASFEPSARERGQPRGFSSRAYGLRQAEATLSAAPGPTSLKVFAGEGVAERYCAFEAWSCSTVDRSIS